MTKHRNENSASRQSVFERLGGKSSSKSIVYCSSWLKTGTCPNGKNCKYVGSHINLSGSDTQDISKPGISGHHSKSKMKPHSSSKSGKDRSSPDQNWDSWDQTDLEYADEKVLEKRLELLRRELLNAEVKSDHHTSRSKHHGRSKHKVVAEKKRKHSSSSSSSSSSGSSSSQSSSSSSSSEETPSAARYKQKRHSASSSPSPKHKPRSFQKHKEKRASPDKKVVRNPKGFVTKGKYKKSSPVKSRHRATPPVKRKVSPVKQNRGAPANKKDKGRGNYSPPPHKRDRKSHSPRRLPDKKASPKRPRTPPHRVDKHGRKSPPVRDNRNQRGNNLQRKSPPLRRNLDRNVDRGGKQQKNVKGRFDKHIKEDNRRNTGHDKREDERLREKCRLLREAELEKERRKSPDKARQDAKKREVDRRDKDRDFKPRDRPDRERGTDQSSHSSSRGDDRRGAPLHSHSRTAPNSARTPAQGRILDRILERKSYLGDRGSDKDKGRTPGMDKERPRDRGLDRVHSEHTSRAGSRDYESGMRSREDSARYPSNERMSPSVRYPDEKRKWDRSFDEGEGEWDRNSCCITPDFCY
ncbi:hypothetical protein M8J76_008006 [Diaphorina citri]|nr:hypothetical protein M8J76_008006 [Diaphorina citri]